MRVVIAEDEALLRQGLRLVLENDGFDVVGAVGTARELEALVYEERPDLVVTDIRMPPTHTDEGLAAAIRIRRQAPTTSVVVLSQFVQRRYAWELLAGSSGGVGYLLKQRIADVPSFCSDLRRVARGGTALDPEVVAMMVARANRTDGAVRRLTDRQREVLALMAEGHSNTFIARQLHLTVKAVVHHTSGIYDAFNLPLDADTHRRVLAVIQILMG